LRPELIAQRDAAATKARMPPKRPPTTGEIMEAEYDRPFRSRHLGNPG
jgi:hypothetical protein